MKAPLTLVISEKMDNNKKSDRYEDKLIRMGEKARHNLGLKDEKTVELWPEGPIQDRINRSKVLEIFQAYSSDLKKAKQSTPEEDYDHIGFVTTKIFNFICKDKRKKKGDIWIADTVEDTIVGADPEFLLMNGDGTIKYAAEIEGFHHSDELGSDGPWAEIRPTPDVDVQSFIKNIQNILRHHKNTKLIQKYSWMGGCYYHGSREGGSERSWPLGGHIHIGTPSKLARAIDSFGDLYRTAVFSCLNKVLDEYVSIPMIKIDGVEDAVKRRKSYGRYGDFRTDYGRLEYRALSGEWLTHPKMAEIVVGTVKAVAHSFFKLLDEASYKHSMIMTKSQQSSSDRSDFYFYDSSFCHWKNIDIMKDLGAIKNSSQMIQIMTEGKVEFGKPFFTSLNKKLRSLPVYKDYSDYIDAFVELVSLPSKELSKRDKELKHTWVGNKEFII
jgi:hypothetical protein